MSNILIIDDNLDTCELLNLFLTKKGYKVDYVTKGSDGVKKVSEKKYNIVLCDFRLPDYDGLKMIELIKEIDRDAKIIIITGYSDVSLAVKSIKKGAFEYVTKPIFPDEILLTIKNAISSSTEVTFTEKNKVEKKPESESESEKIILGSDKSSVHTHKLIKLVSPTKMTVMIIGESGTGKEVMANLIHKKSKRSKEAFISLDCGSLPKELASSELFGHKKGSFTGALQDKKGVFELAHKGTLFLDEIGNLSYDNQIKLLRAIQERKIKPLGSEKEKKVNVRIIVATNEDLKVKVSNGEFREDLFFRLNEFRVDLPPLRDRKNDLKEFADFFLNKANYELEKNVKKIDNDVISILKNHYFPGNIRELQNIIKRAVLMCNADVLTKEFIPDEICNPQNYSSDLIDVKDELSLKIIIEEAEKKAINRALIKARYNKSKAAKLLDIDRKTLYNKMDLYNID